MACRDAYEASKNEIHQAGAESVPPTHDAAEAAASVTGLFFGVDSDVPANELLQNNLTLFEWAVRNKLYPNFWGRSITGEQALTRGEIDFLHDRAQGNRGAGASGGGQGCSCHAGAGNSI